jgi:hypothetical protein
MKVLHAEIIENGKKSRGVSTASKQDCSTADACRLFMALINYYLDKNYIQLTNLQELIEMYIADLLRPKTLESTSATGFLTTQEETIKFLKRSSDKATSYSEPYYEPHSGSYFNEEDALAKLKESKLVFEFSNNIVNYMCLYNLVHRLKFFGNKMAVETNKNLSLISSFGLQGVPFSSTMHPNSSYNVEIFTKNLLRQTMESNLSSEAMGLKFTEMCKGAYNFDANSIDAQERGFLNPYSDFRNEDWIGNLYGYKFKFTDEFKCLNAICIQIVEEIDHLSDLIQVISF